MSEEDVENFNEVRDLLTKAGFQIKRTQREYEAGIKKVEDEIGELLNLIDAIPEI